MSRIPVPSHTPAVRSKSPNPNGIALSDDSKSEAAKDPSRLQAEYEKLKSRYEAKEKQLQELAEMEELHKAEREALEQQLSDSNAKIRKLTRARSGSFDQNKMEELVSRVNSLQETGKLSSGLIESLEERNRSQKKRIEELEQEQERNAMQVANVRALQHRLQAAETEVQALRKHRGSRSNSPGPMLGDDGDAGGGGGSANTSPAMGPISPPSLQTVDGLRKLLLNERDKAQRSVDREKEKESELKELQTRFARESERVKKLERELEASNQHAEVLADQVARMQEELDYQEQVSVLNASSQDSLGPRNSSDGSSIASPIRSLSPNPIGTGLKPPSARSPSIDNMLSPTSAHSSIGRYSKVVTPQSKVALANAQDHSATLELPRSDAEAKYSSPNGKRPSVKGGSADMPVRLAKKERAYVLLRARYLRMQHVLRTLTDANGNLLVNGETEPGMDNPPANISHLLVPPVDDDTPVNTQDTVSDQQGGGDDNVPLNTSDDFASVRKAVFSQSHKDLTRLPSDEGASGASPTNVAASTKELAQFQSIISSLQQELNQLRQKRTQLEQDRSTEQEAARAATIALEAAMRDKRALEDRVTELSSKLRDSESTRLTLPTNARSPKAVEDPMVTELKRQNEELNNKLQEQQASLTLLRAANGQLKAQIAASEARAVMSKESSPETAALKQQLEDQKALSEKHEKLSREQQQQLVQLQAQLNIAREKLQQEQARRAIAEKEKASAKSAVISEPTISGSEDDDTEAQLRAQLAGQANPRVLPRSASASVNRAGSQSQPRTPNAKMPESPRSLNASSSASDLNKAVNPSTRTAARGLDRSAFSSPNRSHSVLTPPADNKGSVPRITRAGSSNAVQPRSGLVPPSKVSRDDSEDSIRLKSVVARLYDNDSADVPDKSQQFSSSVAVRPTQQKYGNAIVPIVATVAVSGSNNAANRPRLSDAFNNADINAEMAGDFDNIVAPIRPSPMASRQRSREMEESPRVASPSISRVINFASGDENDAVARVRATRFAVDSDSASSTGNKGMMMKAQRSPDSSQRRLRSNSNSDQDTGPATSSELKSPADSDSDDQEQSLSAALAQATAVAAQLKQTPVRRNSGSVNQRSLLPFKGARADASNYNDDDDEDEDEDPKSNARRYSGSVNMKPPVQPNNKADRAKQMADWEAELDTLAASFAQTQSQPRGSTRSRRSVTVDERERVSVAPSTSAPSIHLFSNNASPASGSFRQSKSQIGQPQSSPSSASKPAAPPSQILRQPSDQPGQVPVPDRVPSEQPGLSSGSGPGAERQMSVDRASRASLDTSEPRSNSPSLTEPTVRHNSMSVPEIGLSEYYKFELAKEARKQAGPSGSVSSSASSGGLREQLQKASTVMKAALSPRRQSQQPEQVRASPAIVSNASGSGSASASVTPRRSRDASDDREYKALEQQMPVGEPPLPPLPSQKPQVPKLELKHVEMVSDAVISPNSASVLAAAILTGEPVSTRGGKPEQIGEAMPSAADIEKAQRAQGRPAEPPKSCCVIS